MSFIFYYFIWSSLLGFISAGLYNSVFSESVVLNDHIKALTTKVESSDSISECRFKIQVTQDRVRTKSKAIIDQRWLTGCFCCMFDFFFLTRSSPDENRKRKNPQDLLSLFPVLSQLFGLGSKERSDLVCLAQLHLHCAEEFPLGSGHQLFGALVLHRFLLSALLGAAPLLQADLSLSGLQDLLSLRLPLKHLDKNQLCPSLPVS